MQKITSSFSWMIIKDTSPENRVPFMEEREKHSTRDSQGWQRVENTRLWCLQGTCLKNPEVALSRPLKRQN